MTEDDLQTIERSRRFDDIVNELVAEVRRLNGDREALIDALLAYETARDACGAGSGFDDVQAQLERRFDELRLAAFERANVQTQTCPECGGITRSDRYAGPKCGTCGGSQP